MFYRTRRGDSPTSIARSFNVPMQHLIAANPHKPTRVVGNQRTWQALGVGEPLDVPGALGMVGDPIGDALNALISAGGPCLQKNVGFVCALQTALGLTADGKYGTNTAAAAKKIFPGAPPACSPTPLWWGAKGSNKCVGATLPALTSLPAIVPAVTAAIPAATPVSNPAAMSAPPAVAALMAVDPCAAANAGLVCAAQEALGLPRDGKYGANTATAMRKFFPNAHPGCSPTPVWWGVKGSNKCPGAAPAVAVQPSPVAVPIPVAIPDVSTVPVAVSPSAAGVAIHPAVLALATIDPCDAANAALICQAQSALGVSPDGKYGSATKAAADRVIPNAPPACSPRPSWWAPTGYKNCPGSPLPSASTPVSVPQVQASLPSQATPAAQTSLPAPASSGGLVAPSEPKGLSTGAMVAGAVGVAALIGLAVAAASGKKGGGHHAAPHHGPSHGGRKTRKSGGHKAHKASKRRSKKK